MLCEQDGVEIDLEDHNHKTPLMLAKGRKHNDISGYLEKEVKYKKSIIPRLDFKWVISSITLKMNCIVNITFEVVARK